MNKYHGCTHDPISQQRRAAPLDFFGDFLQGTWMDNTPEEALCLWKLKLYQPTSYAADALYALDYVIAKPPHDLIERLQQNGWIYLSHEDDPDEPLYTFDEHLQWLKNMNQQYRQLYKAAIGD